jgi:hypothetical protein
MKVAAADLATTPRQLRHASAEPSYPRNSAPTAAATIQAIIGLAAVLGRDLPSLIKATTLFDFNSGKQLWPVIVPRDMSIFAPAYPHDLRYTNRWWEAHEADATARRAESQRVDGYYAEQNRLREERERKERR